MNILNFRKLSNYKGVVFDCDGVLINSRSASELYINEILVFLGHNKVNLWSDKYDYLFSLKVEDIIVELVPGINNNTVKNAIKIVSYDAFLPFIKLEDNITELLIRLRGNGTKLAILTNRDNNFAGISDIFNFNELFDIILTAEDVLPKPSSEGLLRILDCWKMNKSEIIFIGDSKSDQMASNHADVDFCSYGNKALRNKFLLQNFYL